REIDAAVSWLLPHGNTARFNLDAILRPDTLTRYQAHKVALDSGFLTIDEVRRIEGLEPLTHATTQEDANV
ncbi:MAG: phage portal protein, partial [Cutibacterium avidum]|nr:phage portal protein [Cutibacterium avidum]